MTDPLERLQWLYRHGHFWRPDCADCHNVTWSDLPSLVSDPTHRLVRDAIRVFQASDLNFDTLSLAVPPVGDARPAIADGDVGPVTEAMFGVRRCAMPDWPPPPDAAIALSDAYESIGTDLLEAVESQRDFAATGRGSWPVPGCDPERPNRENEHSVRVNVDTSGASQHQKSLLQEVLRRVERCEAEIGQHVRHILDGDPQAAEHDVRFQFIAGGVIGFAYFPQPDTCRQTVACRIDNSYAGDVEMLAALFVHEYKGHSDGLQHTRGGIMNPSILRIRNLSWIGDPHEDTKRRFYGGEPIEDPAPPDPDPPDSPDPPNGVFVITPREDWPAGEPRIVNIRVTT